MRKVIAAAAAGLIVGVAFAGTAHAHHNTPDVAVNEPGECGTTTITSSWPLDHHQVANAALVVQAGEDYRVAAIGEPVTVGPFDKASVTVKWRVWGGGERNYDSPALTQAGLDELIAWLEEDGTRLPTDADASGVTWHEVTVAGCEPADEPTDEPADEPTDEPEPTEEPSTPATNGQGAGELPKTGAPLPLLTGAGVLLMVAGVVGLVAGRRRTL